MARWAQARRGEEEQTCQPMGPRQELGTGLSGETRGCGFGVEWHGEMNSVIDSQTKSTFRSWLAGLPQPWARTAGLPLDILAQSVPQKGVRTHSNRISILSPIPKLTSWVLSQEGVTDTRDQYTLPWLVVNSLIWQGIKINIPRKHHKPHP